MSNFFLFRICALSIGKVSLPLSVYYLWVIVISLHPKHWQMKWKNVIPSAELITCILGSAFLSFETSIGELEATVLERFSY